MSNNRLHTVSTYKFSQGKQCVEANKSAYSDRWVHWNYGNFAYIVVINKVGRIN